MACPGKLVRQEGQIPSWSVGGLTAELGPLSRHETPWHEGITELSSQWGAPESAFAKMCVSPLWEDFSWSEQIQRMEFHSRGLNLRRAVRYHSEVSDVSTFSGGRCFWCWVMFLVPGLTPGTRWTLRLLHLLALINNPAVNTGVQGSL